MDALKRVNERPLPTTKCPTSRPSDKKYIEEFRKIDVTGLKDDDVLVLKTDLAYFKDIEGMKQLQKAFKEVTGIKNKLIFISREDDISILTRK